MKIRGRIISLLTAAAMIMAMAPQMTVFADGDAGAFTVDPPDSIYSYENGVLTINGYGYYTIYQTGGTDTATSDTIKVDASMEVIITLAGVNIKSSDASPLEITGSHDVKITLSGTNTLDASEASGKAGLQKTSTGTILTITSANGDGSTDGSLTATGGENAAGIGGGEGINGNSITISGGTIEATGGNHGAGIGGGNGKDGSNITISDGTITSTGGENAAGIGGGCGIKQGNSYEGGNSSNIKITGGNVIAKGGGSVNGGAGIGSGLYGTADGITISDGNITATGGTYGAGVGGGSYCQAKNITITGGTIEATGGQQGAGIGGGYQQIGTNINISGGYITATSSYGTDIGSGNEGGNSTVKITGGYFAGEYNTTETAEGYGTGTVYGWNVASGYEVLTNTDSETSSTYPVYVAMAVTISGTAVYGETLTAVPEASASVTGYQWLRNGESISGATGSTYTLTADDVGNNISVKITYDGGTSTSKTVEIGKATPTVTAPTANDLTYNGSAQALVTAGEADGGEMQYSTDNSTWSADIPTKTDVGTYTVYYKVVGDENYNDSSVDSVSVTISKATPTVTAPTAIEGLKYTGSEQELVTAGTTDFGTLEYKLGEDGTYSESIPTATDAGDYTVYYKVEGTDNYDSVEGYVSVTIAKASSSSSKSSGGSSHSLTETTSSKSDTEEMTTDTDYVIGGDGSTTASPTGASSGTTSIFTDVDSTNQYSKAIDYVVSNGLMAGTSATTFEPEAALTRGMIVTILHRLEGEPESESDHGFHDVHDSAWYSEAVAWAAEVGIASGYGDGSFGPEDAITREQLAAILYRYAEYKGYDVSTMAGLGGYTDSHEVGDWAVAAMEWANANGLLDVKGFSSIEPKSEATRGETASTLMSFVENITK